jgi:hypothetical protein
MPTLFRLFLFGSCALRYRFGRSDEAFDPFVGLGTGGRQFFPGPGIWCVPELVYFLERHGWREVTKTVREIYQLDALKILLGLNVFGQGYDFGKPSGGEAGGVIVCKVKLLGIVDGLPNFSTGVSDCMQMFIEIGIPRNLIAKHERGDACLLRPVPHGVSERGIILRPREDTGEFFLRGPGILLQIAKNDEIVLDRRDSPSPEASSIGEALVVVFALLAKRFACLGDLVAVVEVFDGLLDTYSDAKADDDGGDVDEEVSPSGSCVVWWVDV